MKRLTQLLVVVMILTLTAASAIADTLVLKGGSKVSGYYEGGSTRIVKFRGPDGTIKDYDILQVQEIVFGDVTPAPAAPAPVAPSTAARPPAAAAPSTSPQLRPASERPAAQPQSATVANTGYTVPTGTKITIQLVDPVNSETSKVGATFVAVLDQPILVNGFEVAARGADVRGRISNVNEAGRVAGAAQLGLELTQLYVNGIPYSLSTSEYSEVGENRAGQTAKRAGVGAGIGAIIGAAVGGGKGAAIGAGVGGGAATAAQVMTKGEKLNIPAETKLEFALRSPLVIAAR